jgi:hypothetical protein
LAHHKKHYWNIGPTLNELVGNSLGSFLSKANKEIAHLLHPSFSLRVKGFFFLMGLPPQLLSFPNTQLYNRGYLLRSLWLGKLPYTQRVGAPKCKELTTIIPQMGSLQLTNGLPKMRSLYLHTGLQIALS